MIKIIIVDALFYKLKQIFHNVFVKYKVCQWKGTRKKMTDFHSLKKLSYFRLFY